MISRTILIALFVLVSTSLFSQKYIDLETYDVDSLLVVLPGQLLEERVNTLNRLAISLSFIDYDLSTEYADSALTMAKELNYEHGVAAAYRNFGHINVYFGNFSFALSSYFESLSIYEKLNDKRTVAWLYYEIGKTHYFIRNYEKTLEYDSLALDKFREPGEGGGTVGNARDTINIYGSIALAYRIMGDYVQSLKYYLLIFNDNNRIHFDNTEFMLWNWSIGVSYFLLEEYDSARVYINKALSYQDENQHIEALKYRAITFLGFINRNEAKIDSTIYYFQLAYEWYNEQGFLIWALNASTDLGIIYYELNDLTNAGKYFKQSEKLFDEMLERDSWYRYDSMKHIATFGLELYFPLPLVQMKRMMWTYGNSMYYWLYRLNEEDLNFEEALKYHKACFDSYDTLSILQINSEAVELQTKFESIQKEKEIDFLAQENELKTYRLNQSRLLLFGLIGLVIIIIALAAIIIRMNRISHRENSLLLQQKLFRSQMNPHFLFNSLVSIQNFIVNQEPAKAGKYLSKFSKLVRNILDSSFEELVPIEEEIITIENYLGLQKVRFTDKFNYSIDVDESIDTETVMIPPMLAQPIIENSIEHGINHKKGSGNIYVRFKMKTNMIIFEVEDDGIGREKAQEILFRQDKDHKSIATAITHERIQLLNTKHKKKITLAIFDLKNDDGTPAGTKVVFEIPVLYNN